MKHWYSMKYSFFRIALLAALCACSIYAAMIYARSATRLYTVTGPASFEKHDDSTYLVVSGEKQKFEIMWSLLLNNKEIPLYPLTLDKKETYTFTIEEVSEKIDNTGTTVKRHNLVKVIRRNRVVYDREICEIHHCKMERKEVPIIYGLVMDIGVQPTPEQEKTLFPHHFESVLGGCCVMPKKSTLIYVCSKCKDAYEKWHVEHDTK